MTDNSAIAIDGMPNDSEPYGVDEEAIIKHPALALLAADNLLSHLHEMYKQYLRGEISSDDLATGVYHAVLARSIITTLREHNISVMV